MPSEEGRGNGRRAVLGNNAVHVYLVTARRSCGDEVRRVGEDEGEIRIVLRATIDEADDTVLGPVRDVFAPHTTQRHDDIRAVLQRRVEPRDATELDAAKFHRRRPRVELLEVVRSQVDA